MLKLTMEIVDEKLIYDFKCGKESARQATIVFIFNGSLGWEFSKCTYNTLNDMYDIDDWEFLRDLAREVIRLDEEESSA